MRFAWDEAKRQSNLAKHGIDFVDAQTIFLGARFDRFARMVGYEERRLAIGPWGGLFIAVVYTVRGDVTRIISARRARANERRGYQDLYGRGAGGDASPRRDENGLGPLADDD